MAEWLRRRRALRQDRDDALVVGALWVAGSVSAPMLARLTGLPPARAYLALERVMRRGWATTWESCPTQVRFFAIATGGSPR